MRHSYHVLACLTLCTGLAQANTHTSPHLILENTYLSPSKARQERELYFTVRNSGGKTFQNAQNPITVLINGMPYAAKIFGHLYNGGYYMWGNIPVQQHGAILVQFPDPAPFKNWKQCEPLNVVIDPEGKLQGMVSHQAMRVFMQDLDFSSDCRYQR